MSVVIEGNSMVVRGEFDPRLPYSVCPTLTLDSWDGKTAQVRVPWTYENAYALSNVGIDAISPMPVEYPFPMFKFKPFIHQIQGADFLARNRRAYLFNGLGSGKTLTAAWAADYLLQKGYIRKVLVVAFKPTLYSAWGADIETHLPHLPFEVLTDDNAKKRKKKFKSNTPLHIINHDGPAHFWRELYENQYDLIIYDESTAIKNVNTDRWRGMHSLIADRPHTRLWEMTGTPRAQSPMDAYGQIRMMENVNKQAERSPPADIWGGVFMSESEWRDKTMRSVSRGDKTVWVQKDDANDIVFSYMRPAFCKRTEDCVDLPPEVQLPIASLTASKAQKEAWEALRKTDGSYTDGEGRSVAIRNPAAVLSKAIQIACGCLYADTDDNPIIPGMDEGAGRPVIEFDVTEKNKEMLRLINEAEGKAIVFVPFTAVVERVAAWLRKQGKKVQTVYGSMSPQAVHEAINVNFQSDSPEAADVIVGIPQKMSHGLTITAANLIIWYAPIMRGEVYQQANMRIKRIGQRRTMFYAYLSCCSLERDRYRQLASGHESQQDFLQLYEDFMNGVT